jgi:hypothetical protein
MERTLCFSIVVNLHFWFSKAFTVHIKYALLGKKGLVVETAGRGFVNLSWTIILSYSYYWCTTYLFSYFSCLTFLPPLPWVSPSHFYGKKNGEVFIRSIVDRGLAGSSFCLDMGWELGLLRNVIYSRKVYRTL